MNDAERAFYIRRLLQNKLEALFAESERVMEWMIKAAEERDKWGKRALDIQDEIQALEDFLSGTAMQTANDTWEGKLARFLGGDPDSDSIEASGYQPEDKHE